MTRFTMRNTHLPLMGPLWPNSQDTYLSQDIYLGNKRQSLQKQ